MNKKWLVCLSFIFAHSEENKASLERDFPLPPPPFCSTIQGTLPKSRHFLFVDDAVDALLLVLEKGTAGEIYNVGSSCEIPIMQLARELVKMVGLWGNCFP